MTWVGNVDPHLPLSSRPFRRRVVLTATEFLFFFALALFSTWPLAKAIPSALPVGTEGVATVPLFNLWTVWWNADRLAHGLEAYWNAPIFYPTEGTFAFSEPQPVSLAVAPLVWMNRAPVAAYNSYLLLSLTLNGWLGGWLVRDVTGRRASGLAGGAMLLMLPFIHWQLGVLQLVPIWGVLWTIGALRRFPAEPRVSRALSLGAALAATYLSCAYHGLFLILLLLGSGGWLLGRNLWSWRALVRLVPGVLLCLALVFPVLKKQREIIRKFEFERTADIIITLSADAGDYSVTPWPQLWRSRDFADSERRPWWFLGPGNVKLLLAGLGIVIGLIDRRLRWWTLFAVTFTALAVVLSLGLKFKLGTWIPYQLLVDRFPGMAQVRNVFRFALFAQLMVAVLAAQGLELISPVRWREICADWRRPARLDSEGGAPAETTAAPPAKHGWKLAGAALALLVGGVAAVEVCPASQRLFDLPAPEENAGWTSWLAQNTPPEAVLACVPFPPGATVDDYQETALWMYWGAFHRRRMVNGYSGFFPPEFMKLKPTMDFFPDPQSLDALEAAGVGYCVARHKSIDPVVWDRLVNRFPDRLKPRYWDEKAGVGVFELVGAEAEPP